MQASNFYEAFLKRSPLFKSANCVRDLAYLEPIFRAQVEDILDKCGNLGRPLLVTETYRSKARQEALFLAGATQLRTIGCHHMGLACDFAKLVSGTPTWKGDWTFLGKLANERGLVWGGPGKGNLNIADRDHIQRCSLADQPYVFNQQFYPDAAYRAWSP